MSCIKCGTNVLATAKTGQCEKFKDDGAQTDRGTEGGTDWRRDRWRRSELAKKKRKIECSLSAVSDARQDDGHYTLCKCCGSFNNPGQASGWPAAAAAATSAATSASALASVEAATATTATKCGTYTMHFNLINLNS